MTLREEIFIKGLSYCFYFYNLYKSKPLLNPKLVVMEMSTLENTESQPEYNKIDTILKKHPNEKSSLIAVLQDIENKYKYLPSWTLRYVSKKLEVPLIQVFGVASFYDAFHLTPQGKHLIRVCLGTACYLKGSNRVLEALENELGVKDGQTTSDLEYTIQSVRCLGACALAPVMIIDDHYYDKMTPLKVAHVLKQVKSNHEED